MSGVANWLAADLITATKLDQGAFSEVANLAGLKAVNTTLFTTSKKALMVSINKFYYFDPASTATADDYLVVQPTTGSGRWLLINNGGSFLGGKIFLVDASHPDAVDTGNDGTLPFATFSAGLTHAATISNATLMVAPGDYSAEDGGTPIYVSATNGLTVQGVMDHSAHMVSAGMVLLPMFGLTNMNADKFCVKDVCVKSIHISQSVGTGGNVSIDNIKFTGASGTSVNGSDALNGEALCFEDGVGTTGDRAGITVNLRDCYIPGKLWYAYKQSGGAVEIQGVIVYCDSCSFASGASLPANSVAPGFDAYFSGCNLLGTFTVGAAVGAHLLGPLEFINCEINNRLTFSSEMTFNFCKFRATQSVLYFANDSLTLKIRLNGCDLQANYGTSASDVIGKAGGTGTKTVELANSFCSGTARTIPAASITTTTITTAFL